MARCKIIGNTKRRICVGSLDKRIDIIYRGIVPNDISYTMDLTDKTNIPASVRTKTKTATFDGINVETTLTHLFRIRYGISVEKNNTIKFNGKCFRVTGIENIDGMNRFQEIETTERGDSTKEGSFV